MPWVCGTASTWNANLRSMDENAVEPVDDSDRFRVEGRDVVECVMAYGRLSGKRIEQNDGYLSFRIYDRKDPESHSNASIWIKRNGELIRPNALYFEVNEDDEVQLHTLFC